MLYSSSKEEISIADVKEEQTENICEEEQIDEVVEQSVFVEQEDPVVVEQEIEQEPVPIVPEKVNKYKLLKEKIRNKKQ